METNTIEPGKKVLNRSGRYRSKAIALLLLVLVGQFGAHNFYLKRKPIAYTQLGITLSALLGVIVIFATALLSPTQPDGSIAISNAFGIILGFSLTFGGAITIGAWLLLDIVLILFSHEPDLDWDTNRRA